MTVVFSAIFTDEMRVTYLYSKISLVFPEDSVSVDEFFKAVKNIVVYIMLFINCQTTATCLDFYSWSWQTGFGFACILK